MYHIEFKMNKYEFLKDKFFSLQGGRNPHQARSTLSYASQHSARSGPLPPQQHTMVTVTTDPTPGATVTEINLDLGYYKTLPGILKLVQLVRFLIFYTLVSGIGCKVTSNLTKLI